MGDWLLAEVSSVKLTGFTPQIHTPLSPHSPLSVDHRHSPSSVHNTGSHRRGSSYFGSPMRDLHEDKVEDTSVQQPEWKKNLHSKNTMTIHTADGQVHISS